MKIKKTIRFLMHKVLGNQWKISLLPKVEILSENTSCGSCCFVSPELLRNREYQDKEGQKVGSVQIGRSPLYDKVYIFRIDVSPNRQRVGFGLAILKSIYDEFNLPLIAVKEIAESIAFWNKAREVSGKNFMVLPQLHMCEMELEQKRWEHLKPPFWGE